MKILLSFPLSSCHSYSELFIPFNMEKSLSFFRLSNQQYRSSSSKSCYDTNNNNNNEDIIINILSLIYAESKPFFSFTKNTKSSFHFINVAAPTPPKWLMKSHNIVKEFCVKMKTLIDHLFFSKKKELYLFTSN